MLSKFYDHFVIYHFDMVYTLMLLCFARSLFVPYFKYLLDGCVRHLSNSAGGDVSLIRKKKKAKVAEENNSEKGGNGTLSVEMWHLRTLILSSLHKCFLYDTGNLKFLDSSNFQASTLSV